MEDIKKIEQSIEKMCALESGSLSKIVLEEISKTGINLDKAIFMFQNSMVETEVSTLLETQSKASEEIKKKIDVVEGEYQIPRELRQEQVRFLNEKMAVAKLVFEEKLKAIEQWRIRMKAKLRVDEKVMLEPTISAEFLKDDSELTHNVLQRLITSAKSKKVTEITVKEAFNQYLSSLEEREQAIEKLLARMQNVKSHLTETLARHSEGEKKNQELEQEGMQCKSAYAEICVNEKSLEQKKMEKEDSASVSVKRKEEEDYKTFLRKNNEIFKGVKKTHGVNMVEKIKAEHKKEIGELALIKQVERKREIRKTHETLLKVKAILESQEVFEHLTSQINLVINSYNQNIVPTNVHIQY